MNEYRERLQRALEGRYRIEREIGEGGMATVYLAADLKHDRMVALKLLKPELAAVVGAQRFLAEIKTTAHLQHPHILPLFDSGEADGLLFYVMPYVAGESLRARLEREHQLPVPEAVKIAAAVAQALDYAHRHGVIHRDIKPENILLHDGEPVVADFGIALAVSAAGRGRLTETGLSVGTPHYMSPEQATGDQNIGSASDIYALACVLYESLAGDPPHTGSTAQAILAKILTETPAPVATRRKAVPANVDEAIRRALERIPADRFATAREFAAALVDPGFRHSASVVPLPSPSRRRTAVLALGGWVAAATLAFGWFIGAGQAEPAVLNRLEVGIPLTHSPGALSLSPDGRTVFYTAGAVFRRPLDALQSEEIPGTEGATDVSISPDGQWAAFVQGSGSGIGRQLKKVRLSGGPAVELVANHPFRGISWESMDTLVIGSHEGGLFRVAAEGGKPEPLTDPGGGAPHRYPRSLPGQRGVLFHVGGSLADDSVAVLPRGETKWRILTAGTDASYVAGHVMFYRDGGLWAAPFDLDLLELTAEPVPVLPAIGRRNAKAVFESSVDGSLFYVEPPPASEHTLAWVGRDGAEEAVPIPELTTRNLGVPSQINRPPVISPDGTKVLVLHSETLWVHDLVRGGWERLTGEDASEWDALWSPGGDAAFFMSRRNGPFELFRISLGGTRGVEAVGALGRNPNPTAWTPDGRGLIYGSPVRVWWLADGRSEPLLEPGSEARLSPDGRYLAYQVNNGVEVRPYPDVTSKRWRMPSVGAVAPEWSTDGKHLYYLVRGAIMEVSVNTGGDFTYGEPARILEGPYLLYDVARDGRFLVVRQDDRGVGEDRARLIVVQHWMDELRRLVPN